MNVYPYRVRTVAVAQIWSMDSVVRVAVVIRVHSVRPISTNVLRIPAETVAPAMTM